MQQKMADNRHDNLLHTTLPCLIATWKVHLQCACRLRTILPVCASAVISTRCTCNCLPTVYQLSANCLPTVCQLSANCLPTVCQKCCFLQVQSLRQLCIEHIMYSLTLETVLTYAVTAHSLSDASLLDACWTFIKTSRNR